jgi:hypothetical protein
MTLPSHSDAQIGLIQKYIVARVDGRDQAGGDKADARYFVLDYVHDRLAQFVLLEYAERVWYDNPQFAEDLWRDLREAGAREFTTIPERRAENDRLRRQVLARMIELYGPDEDKWPQPVDERGR